MSFTRHIQLTRLLWVALLVLSAALLPSTAWAQGGPVLHWPLDEESGTIATDNSGNSNDGTVQGNISWIDGRANGGMDFSATGIGDYIIKTAPSSFPTTAITTSFWVRTTDSNDGLVSYATSHSDNEWLVFNSNGLAVFRGAHSITFPKSVSNTRWHHVVITWQSSDGQCQLYLNGKLASTVYMTGSIGTSIPAGGTLIVGQEQDTVGGGFAANQGHEGSLDELRIFDRVITPQEAQDIYTADLGEHLMFHFTFDDDTGTQVIDSSDYSNDALAWGSVDWTAGVFGDALDLTATGKYDKISTHFVDAIPAIATTNTFWIKTTDSNNGIITYTYGSYGLREWIICDSSNLTIYRGKNNQPLITNTAVNDGQWHHVGVTWRSSDGETKLYVDGELEATGTVATGSMITGAGVLMIGQMHDQWGRTLASASFEGLLDDVRIYSHVLSEQQIRDTMTPGGSAPANYVYGLWNWDSTIMGDNERIEEMVQFCLDLGITEVGFSINWNQPFSENPNNIPALEDLLTRLHANNIKVEMLAGNANWIYHHDQGPLQGKPVGGVGYDFGVQLVERFMAYQDERYSANPEQCFDGIRMDIEPHGLRTTVTNGMLVDPNDPRRVPGGDNAVAIAGTDGEPYLFIQWDPNYFNGYENGVLLPVGSFTDSSIADRNEIMLRFWDALKRFKAQIQDDRGAGHITNDSAAVTQFLQMSTDQVPWYWTIGVQNENGYPLIDGSGNPVPDPQSGEVHTGHAMVDHDGDPGTPDIEVFKAALGVPDKVALMGYRDQYEHWNNGNLFWFRSVKQWDQGYNTELATGFDPDGNPLAPGVAAQFANPRGVLPYLQSINKPTSVGLEFIAETALGFHSSSVTFAGDPYAQLKDTISQVSSDLQTLYPTIRGIRYHEYYEPLPGKAAEQGEIFSTFSTWIKAEVFGIAGNLADWQLFHNVTPGQTPTLPALINVPVVTDPDALTLTLEGGSNEFEPGPGKSGFIKATINGLPTGTSADDFYIVAHVKVLGDTYYFQGGQGTTETINGLLPANNGPVDANGFFQVAPIRIGDISVAKIVWWLDMHNANGHFIRRFVLDPNDPDDPTLQADRFYNPHDPLNIDVQGLLPDPIDLTFSNIVASNVQKVGGTISGTVTGFPAGADIANEYHVRTWVQLLQDGINAGLPADEFPDDTDPNWRAEQNGWSVLATDVALDSSGNFTAVNARPINPTGDSADYGESNGTYKIHVSVHTNGDDGMARLGFPSAETPNDGMKPTISRYLDMDFSIVDSMDGTEAVTAGVDNFDAGYDMSVHFIGVDNKSGTISGNVTGLSSSPYPFLVYVWVEYYDYDRNIWHKRVGFTSIADNDTGYFEANIDRISIIHWRQANEGITTASPRNIWISVHDGFPNLNQFPEISDTAGNPDDGNPPDVTSDGNWLGRFFHMDDSFLYYEGFRPAEDTVIPTVAPGAATSLAASAIDSASIELTWSHTSTVTNEEVGFKIERRTGTDPFALISKIHGGDTTSFTFDDTGLSPSTTYDYRITAFNDIGDSSVSAIATATTTAAGAPTLASVNFAFGGAGGYVNGRILNMPSGNYNVRTWLKTDSYYRQGKDITPAADGTFNAAGLWGSGGSTKTIYVTLHPDGDDPWGDGVAANVSWWNWPTDLGSNAVVFGPFATQ